MIKIGCIPIFLFLQRVFIQDNLGHPFGCLTHDLRAMDIVGSGIVEFFVLLRVGKIVVSTQNFVLDISADD